MTIAAMVPHEDGNVELHLGILVDDQFGPLVVVAPGGVLVEAFDDRSVAMPPLSVDRAGALLNRLRLARVLDGMRGSPPVDRSAVAAAISALSQLAIELGEVLEAVDINPLIAGPRGCIAADALVVPSSRRGDGAAESDHAVAPGSLQRVDQIYDDQPDHHDDDRRRRDPLHDP
jgi:hypothetical protein